MLRIQTIALCIALTFCACVNSKEKEKVVGDPTKGKTTFEQQCAACHRADSTDKKIGPGLKGLFARTKLANGQTVNVEAVRDQIENGNRHGMPAYRDLLSSEEKNNLLAFLKTL